MIESGKVLVHVGSLTPPLDPAALATEDAGVLELQTFLLLVSVSLLTITGAGKHETIVDVIESSSERQGGRII